MFPALRPTTAQAAPVLSPGDKVQVTNTLTTGLRCPDSPGGRHRSHEEIRAGTSGSTISGPVSAALDGITYTWWEVRWGDDGQQGWSAAGFQGVWISPKTDQTRFDEILCRAEGSRREHGRLQLPHP